MQIINVCGLKRRLKVKECRKTFQRTDISFLSETKLDDADIDNIQDSIINLNLKAFFKNRNTLAARRSGGLCILYNINIEKHITHIISKCKLVQWLKISKDFLGTDKDIMVGNTYVPPMGTRFQSITPFQELQVEIIKYDNCYVCIAGDLNSHTGTVRDYVEIEDFMPDQLNSDREAVNQLNCVKLLQSHRIRLSRSNTDSRSPNIYGDLLIELCKTNNLLICNGRLNSDVQGKATTRDKSLIDYLLACPSILVKVENFFVHDFDAIFSDKHCRVSWTIKGPNLKHKHINDVKSKIITIKKCHRNMWDRENAVDFSNQLNIDEVNNIKEKIGNSNSEIDDIVSDIQKLFKSTADTILGKEYEYEIDINKERKPMKFDLETRNIRNRYLKAKRLNNGTDDRKAEVAIASKAYKKAVLKAEALHRKQLIKKLRNAKTKDPKFYWSVLNRRTNKGNNSSRNVPPLTDFFEGFKTLSGNDSHGDFAIDSDETCKSRDDHDLNR